MSEYIWLNITTVADYDQLANLLDPDFAPARVAERLKSSITTAVKGVLIEFGYIDKDYRSTFYRFYAKKGRRYRDDCIRIHFFDDQISFDDPTTSIVSAAGGSVGDHYFGFIVLRPTIVATIGRTILSPNVRAGARGQVIQSRHRVHLLGHRLEIWGFPAMAQPTDIAVCAHVSCWAILRHYSERFPQHRELLLHDITMMSQQFDPGGLTPSLGLNVREAERVFQAAGTYPLIVVKKKGTPDLSFYAQMLAYLESGFPLFVAMNGQAHAIVAAGVAWRSLAAPSFTATPHAWEQVESVVVIDDNHLPYASVRADQPLPAPTASPGEPSYNASDFDAFIVALPEKIFYDAGAVETYSQRLLGLLPGLPSTNLLRRYFVTTISGLRHYAREYRSQLGDELVNVLMRLDTAQFVWVVEYATEAQWMSGHITARAIIDATASPHDQFPIWFVHDDQNGIIFDRSQAKPNATVLALNRPGSTPLGRMERNLRPIKPLS